MSRYQRGDRDNEDRRDSGTRRVASSGGPLVVFADDSAVQTLKTKELLEEAGYRTSCCADGITAVERVRQLLPDLVILDLEMPGQSGVDALREIKSNKALAHIPVLILTAHDEPKHLVASFEAGCAGYLVKGMTDAAFLGKVARHVRAPVGIAR